MMVAHDQPQDNSSKQQLLDFLETVPETIYLAAIVAKGEEVAGKISEGKRPLPSSILKPGRKGMKAKTLAETARTNNAIRAVGVWTGPLNNGIVILDVDARLSALQAEWGDSLKGAPFITSTKRNAGKYLFWVPETLWKKVNGRSLASTAKGYEILWGQQGIIFGEYPGHKGAGAPPGMYSFNGKLDYFPTAPDWLLDEMQLAYHEVGEKNASNFLRTDIGARRSREEKLQIIEECLKHIPVPGPNSYYEWFRVGNAIKSTVDDEAALNLWREWSMQDDAYETEWKTSDPCLKKWEELKPNGSVSLGTLIYLATHDSIGRKLDVRFQDCVEEMIEEERREGRYEEMLKETEKALRIDNPSIQAVKLNEIASEYLSKDSGYLLELYSMHMEYEKSGNCLTYKEMLEKPRVLTNYVIPGLMPSPSVILLHGAGGIGKSVTAWLLARHILKGIPFNVHGTRMPVNKGTVLIINGDQSDTQLINQLDLHGITGNDPVWIQSGWNMSQEIKFFSIIEEIKPTLIIVDSLTSCASSVHEENKKEFANPLYRLTKGNGTRFPACVILVLHHSNKQGGFRGTSAIQAAVDEVWSLKEPPQGSTLGPKARLLTIEKSRIVGRQRDQQFVQKCDRDEYHTIEDLVNIQNIPADLSTVQNRVLAELRAVYPERRTVRELGENPKVDAGLPAVKRAIRHLLEKSFIVQDGVLPTKKQNHSALYKAVVSFDPQFVYEDSGDDIDEDDRDLRAGDGGLNGELQGPDS